MTSSNASSPAPSVAQYCTLSYPQKLALNSPNTLFIMRKLLFAPKFDQVSNPVTKRFKMFAESVKRSVCNTPTSLSQ